MKKILLITTILILNVSLSAQYYYIPNTTNPGNPGGLNTDAEYPGPPGGAGGMPAGWNTILGSSNSSPTWSSTETIPFSFNFNGSPVTQYKVSSSGILTFTTSASTVPTYSNAAIPNASIPDQSVLVWGIEGSGANDEIVTKTFGSAGSQQHWIWFASYTYGTLWTYWSIVLEEGSDKIYIVDQRTNGTIAVTAGIQLNSTTAFSVANSPSLTTLSANQADDSDNYYYEFVFGSQPDDDAKLTSLNITSYSVAPAIIDIEGVITNVGGNTINAMDITWTDGTNSYTDNLSGLNIAANATYNFTHADQLNLASPGAANLTVTIDNVNTNIDPDMSNNSLTAIANAVTFIPTKRVVFEEATGTWCGWCPRGAVALETLEQNYPGTAIGIAVHNGDAMTVTAYDAGMNVGGYPSGHVDRAILDVNPGDFMQYYSDRINEISPVDISATAVFDATTRMIDINLSGEFVANLSGDYRFNAVILEDVVGPYSQANYYSGGGAGPLVSPISGFDWAAASDPVSVTFDHVAREILGGFDGTTGSLPATITAGGIHTHNYTHTLPANQNENNVHVVGMIIDNATGEILNGIKVELSGFTPNSWNCISPGNCQDPGTGQGAYSTYNACAAACVTTAINEDISNLSVYPNPVKDVLIIKGMYSSLEIYDIYGKLVLTAESAKNINVSGLTSGVYMLNINTEKGTATQRITIAK
jgi:thiol-disulfide isomerase/thioredoxin